MRALPEGIHVKRAGPGDVERIRPVMEEGLDGYRSWAPGWTPPVLSPEQRERLAANFARDDVWIGMALEGADVVGVVSIAEYTAAMTESPPAGTVYLWQMFVRPAWQGRGLAQALMDLASAQARERGFDRMVLWAAAGAEQARRFYEREGWTLTGEEQPAEAEFGLPLVQYELTL